MSDPGDLLAGGLPHLSPFGPTSRYAGLPIVELVVDDVIHRYVTRRFVPDPDGLVEQDHHVVVEGDRPDNLAAAAYGDPELFWRLCDANRAVFADELVATIGRSLRITLSAGIPGVP